MSASHRPYPRFPFNVCQLLEWRLQRRVSLLVSASVVHGLINASERCAPCSDEQGLEGMITLGACLPAIFPVDSQSEQVMSHPTLCLSGILPEAWKIIDHVQINTWPRTSFCRAISSLVLRAVYSRILCDGERALRALTYIWDVALRDVNANACGTASLVLTSIAPYCRYVPAIRCSMQHHLCVYHRNGVRVVTTIHT